MQYVYILENEFMPGIVKVGFTTRNPRERAAELASATGVPGAFKLYEYFPVSSGKEAEALIYSCLNSHRINSKEFLRLTGEAAAQHIKAIIEEAGLLDQAGRRGADLIVPSLLYLMEMRLKSEKGFLSSEFFSVDILKPSSSKELEEAMDIFHDLGKRGKPEDAVREKLWSLKTGHKVKEGIYSFPRHQEVVVFLYASGFIRAVRECIKRDEFLDRGFLKGQMLNVLRNIIKVYLSHPSLEILIGKSYTSYKESLHEVFDDVDKTLSRQGYNWCDLYTGHPFVKLGGVFSNARNEPDSRLPAVFGFRPVHQNLNEGCFIPRVGSSLIFNGVYYTYSVKKSEDFYKKDWEIGGCSPSYRIHILIKENGQVEVDARCALRPWNKDGALILYR